MTSETIARCIKMVEGYKVQFGEYPFMELSALLERELYMASQGKKAGAAQKVSALNSIIKSGIKSNRQALSGAFVIPNGSGMIGYCDGYRAIRTREEYPTPRIHKDADPVNLNEVFKGVIDSLDESRAVTIDRAKLAAAKAKKIKYCAVGGVTFDTNYLHCMVQFFDTDTFIAGPTPISPVYFKNEAGEDGILCTVRAKENNEAESIAA